MSKSVGNCTLSQELICLMRAAGEDLRLALFRGLFQIACRGELDETAESQQDEEGLGHDYQALKDLRLIVLHYDRGRFVLTDTGEAVLDYLRPDYQKHIRELERKRQRKLMTRRMRFRILERDNFRCKICGQSANDGAKLEVDHIVPISKGGLTEPGNLMTLCFDCNRGKAARLL